MLKGAGVSVTELLMYNAKVAGVTEHHGAGVYERWEVDAAVVGHAEYSDSKSFV